jgi:hypothetical protein
MALFYLKIIALYFTSPIQSDDSTVQVSCLDAPLALAVLDFSIELGEKESQSRI